MSESEPVHKSQLAAFMRQLGAMLNRNVDPLRALRVAAESSGNPQLKAAAQHIGSLLVDGRDFSKALTAYPDLFDAFCVEMARQGENDGVLGQALLSTADYLDHLALAEQVQGSAPSSTGPGGAALEREGTLFLATLGILCLGIGLLWSLDNAGVLSAGGLGPLCALWAGLCFLAGARAHSRLPRTGVILPLFEPKPLPPKSAERRDAETSSVVENAILEQDEALPVPDFTKPPRLDFD